MMSSEMPRLKNCWVCDISSGAGLFFGWGGGGGGVGDNEHQRHAFSGGPEGKLPQKYLKI